MRIYPAIRCTEEVTLGRHSRTLFYNVASV